MIYGVDDVSRRQYKLFLKDLNTGKTTDLGIKNTTGSATWANDNKTIFYTGKNPETLLTEKIYRHSLGTDPSQDALVYEEKDKSNYIGVGKSKNEKASRKRSKHVKTRTQRNAIVFKRNQCA
mgnify:CR=1 FL=1